MGRTCFGVKRLVFINTGIETNSLQHRGDSLHPVFQISVYIILRKRKVLETNLNAEEITNFYPIFKHFYIDLFQNFNVFFLANLTSVGGPIRLGIC